MVLIFCKREKLALGRSVKKKNVGERETVLSWLTSACLVVIKKKRKEKRNWWLGSVIEPRGKGLFRPL